MWGVPSTYLSLNEYQEWLQIPEPYFYGIRNHPVFNAAPTKGCGDYWNQSERYWLADSIAKVEHRLEADKWLGFPLRRKHVGVRQVPYSWPIMLGKYIRSMGIMAETTIQNGVILNLSDPLPVGIIDPVVFTVATTVIDADEILIYYPGQRKYTIRPSEITIAAGVATITIPRSRLLAPAYFIDYVQVNARPDYQNDSYFTATVDVVRNYVDTSSGNYLVWWRHPGNVNRCCSVGLWECEPSDPCGEVKQSACTYIEEQRRGIVHLEPASYTTEWTKTAYAICGRNPDGVEVSYMQARYDRYQPMDEDIVRAVIALAHNNMPVDVCTRCSMTQQYYARDVKPLEPAVNNGWGDSTWGNFEAINIVREFDSKSYPYKGGALI